MNDDSRPPSGDGRSVGRDLRRVGCGILVLAAVLGPLMLPPLDAVAFPAYQTIGWVVFGWIGFLWQTLPHVGVHFGTLCLGLVGALAFVVLAHGLAGWIHRERGGDRPWRWQWTAAAAALFAILFVVGTAMIGVVHQVGWMVSEGGVYRYEYGASRRYASKSNLKQIGIAVHNHHDTHSTIPHGLRLDATGRPMHSWITRLLPMLEQAELHDRIDRSRPWNDPANAAPMGVRVHVLENPGVRGTSPAEELGYGVAHYAGNDRLFDAGPARRFRDVADGLSNTLLAGEVVDEIAAWGDPLNVRDPARGLNDDPRGFGGPWTGPGAQFVLADGSVRFVSRDVDPRVLRALATPGGGEDVSGDDW